MPCLRLIVQAHQCVELNCNLVVLWLAQAGLFSLSRTSVHSPVVPVSPCTLLQLFDIIKPLKRGASASEEDREDVDAACRALEKLNPNPKALSSPLINGKWEVRQCPTQDPLTHQRGIPTCLHNYKFSYASIQPPATCFAIPSSMPHMLKHHFASWDEVLNAIVDGQHGPELLQTRFIIITIITARGMP